jgi:hypothetical protein
MIYLLLFFVFCIFEFGVEIPDSAIFVGNGPNANDGDGCGTSDSVCSRISVGFDRHAGDEKHVQILQKLTFTERFDISGGGSRYIYGVVVDGELAVVEGNYHIHVACSTNWYFLTILYYYFFF